LSEFTHVEAELDFIQFENLMDHIENLVVGVVEATLADKEIAGFIHAMNPTFQKPTKPFLRMSYLEALDWLNAQDPPILNEEDKPHVFGDDIAEAAERKMTDTINKPILLHSFPAALKSFYASHPGHARARLLTTADEERHQGPEADRERRPALPRRRRNRRRVDEDGRLRRADGRVQAPRPRPGGVLLVQRPAEVSGTPKPGEPLTWRRYGTSPHGGYGLGLERFIAWMANQHTVRTCCLYPRFMGRAKP
jgi:asparaginyl-tRNA synthetase